MAYYTLLERIDDTWMIAFGDFDWVMVMFEHEDYTDNGTKVKDLKVVRTRTSRQSEIDSILVKLNHKAR